MGGGFMYHVFSFSALMSLGLFHLICTTRNYLKSPRDYIAKPFQPLSLSPNHPHQLRFTKHLQLYLAVLFLFVAFLHQTIVSVDPDPLLKGHSPVHRFTSLQSAAILFIFLLLSLSLLLSDATSLLPIPSDLFFALAAAVFFLHYSAASSSSSLQTSDLEAKCDSVSATISAVSASLCLALACNSRLFIADASLAASLCLQGLWSLQTGLSLYVDAFIPDGCHKLLDVVSGVEGSTKCDLEDSKLRAIAILDLLFVLHVLFILIIFMVTYALVAKTVGIRRFGSYEALPTGVTPSAAPAIAADSTTHTHIQMKALSGTQA